MREAIGNPILTPGIDDDRDEGVRDAEGEKQRAGGPDLRDDVGGQPAERDQRGSHRVGREERGRDQQPAANVPVDARASKRERGHEKRKPDDH